MKEVSVLDFVRESMKEMSAPYPTDRTPATEVMIAERDSVVMKVFKKHSQTLKWEPGHAAFQLSEDKFYGRHEKNIKGAIWTQIHHEVLKSWSLKPFAHDSMYVYYKK